MDNVIHTLCALALSRAGVGRLGPWSTGTLVLASNVPDLDGVMLLWGDQQAYLEQHRGISHALPGMLLEGALLGLAMFLMARRRGVPAKFMTLTAVAWLGLLIHLGLDALNSYGVRPWLPFDDRWVYLDVAFVADPWIWLGLTMAAALGGPRGWRKATGWLTLLCIGAALLFSTRMIPVTAGILWCIAMSGVLLMRARGIGAGHGTAMAWGGLMLTAGYLALLAVGSATAHGRVMEVLGERVQGRVERTSTHPQPGVPWRFRAVVQTPERLHRTIVDLGRGTVDGITVQPRGLNDPVLDRVRFTPEYRTWVGFARHRFAGMWEGQLVLGDGRYSRSAEPAWSNLVVPLDSPPTRSK